MLPISQYIKRPNLIFLALLNRLAPVITNDKLFLKMLYRVELGRKLDLKNPKRFTEKLQWLKLYNRKPEYTTMVDKYAVKDYVAGKIGEEYIIPTLGVWKHFDEIDFDTLPERFVLKTTHGGGGGGVVICKNKSTFDRDKARRVLESSLKSDIYTSLREWPYKNVPRRIIAEKFITNGYDEDLTDYKFYCFNGEPRYCQVIADRHSKETIDFYDMEWNHMPFYGLNPKCGPAAKPAAKPAAFLTMQRIANELAKDTEFVRIDMYSVNDTTYFGEITFYPAGGIGVFSPDSADFDLGKLLELKAESCGGGYKILINNDLHIQKLEPELKDYKFFCFNGEVKFFKVDFNRFVDHHANYYDLDWNLLPFCEECFQNDINHVETKPDNFDEMVQIASSLSTGTSFLRVDLYNINGKIYFGELTFFPASGMKFFIPDESDSRIGQLLSI